jgi:hypothetical protein
MRINVLYSVFQNFYHSGLCIYFHSPDTLTDIRVYIYIYTIEVSFLFFFLLNIFVLDVEYSFSSYKLQLNQFS